MTYVTLDIDLDNFSDKDLKAELQNRGYSVTETNSDVMRELYEALKLNKIDKAMSIAKQLAQDETGRIL